MVDYYRTAAGLENRNGHLYMTGHSLAEIAEEYGTPVHVINAEGIRKNYSALKKALEVQKLPYRILYAMKANSNSAILKVLKKEGAWIDAVSYWEAMRALKCGFAAERIMFTGSWASKKEMLDLVRRGITLNIDSIDDLDELIATGKMPQTVSFRVNGEFGAGHSHQVITGGPDSQFGIWQDRIVEAYRKAKEAGAKKFGMHVHIGSGVLESSEFLKAAEIVLEMAGKVRRETGITFEFIDFGGGLGVPYKPGQEPLDVEKHFSQLAGLFKKKAREYELGNPALAVEPGRFLVCDAEVMLAEVRSVKNTPEKNFARTTISMNDLVRHAMYGAYHHILVDGKAGKPENTKYTVTGLICETGDRIATDRMLPRLEKGDLLVVLNTGAYGYSMGSDYNSRPRPAVILIDGKKKRPVSRRETIADVTRNEVGLK